MILGTKARYAVMAMVDLAGRGGERPVCLADISERQEIPLAYLEQIFNKLKKGGLVKSVRGPGGGYVMVKSLEETRIADIVLAVDESIKMTRCESHKTGKDGAGSGCMAGRARCLTHDLWEGLGDRIYDYLVSVSLKDVCIQKLQPKVSNANSQNFLAAYVD